MMPPSDGQLVAEVTSQFSCVYRERPRQTPGPFRIRLFAMSTLVTRTYLELRSPADLRPASTPVPGAARRAPRASARPRSTDTSTRRWGGPSTGPTACGGATRRSEPTSRRRASRSGCSPGRRLRPAISSSSRTTDGSIEIAYFGLLPEYFGRGWGKYLLTEAAREAWRGAPTRVWLHTCTLDHPAALPNYLQRGFTAGARGDVHRRRLTTRAARIGR